MAQEVSRSGAGNRGISGTKTQMMLTTTNVTTGWRLRRRLNTGRIRHEVFVGIGQDSTALLCFPWHHSFAEVRQTKARTARPNGRKMLGRRRSDETPENTGAGSQLITAVRVTSTILQALRYPGTPFAVETEGN